MASVFWDLASKDCLSARQLGELHISTFYRKYSLSMQSEHNYVAYQWKANEIYNSIASFVSDTLNIFLITPDTKLIKLTLNFDDIFLPRFWRVVFKSGQ